MAGGKHQHRNDLRRLGLHESRVHTTRRSLYKKRVQEIVAIPDQRLHPAPAPVPSPARLLARPAGLLLRGALHLAGRAGTSLPGRITLRLDPEFLARARAHKRRILVTGTNGKTSTVALICHLLRQAGLRSVANRGGANLPQGLATALLDRPADALVLEVDELTLPRVIGAIEPDLVLVTGLFRDQLDRHGEVRSVRDQIAAGLARAPDALRLLNGDDPLTASLAGANTRFFRLSQPALEVPADGTDCPICGAALEYTLAHLRATWRIPLSGLRICRTPRRSGGDCSGRCVRLRRRAPAHAAARAASL